MKIRFWCVSLLVWLGASALWSQSSDPGYKPATRTFALKNATVVVKPGQTIANATVLVREGLIVAVGTNISIPADARVIAADSMFVYAGFIDALSYAGIPVKKEDPMMMAPGSRPRIANAANPTNEQAGIQPEIKAREVLSAQEKSLEDLRKLGFTTAHVVPQGRMLPGSGGVFLTAGASADEMLLKDNTSMFATLNGARMVYPSTVIGVMSKFRDLYKQAEQSKAHEAAFMANPAGLPRPDYNQALQAFYPVIDKKQPVYFAAEDVKSMYRVLNLQQELGFPLVLSGLKQGWHLVDAIKAKNIPVVLSTDLPKAKETPKEDAKAPKTEPSSMTDAEKQQLEARAAEEMKKLESQAATFAGKGVSFSFATFNGKASDVRSNFQRMIKNGLSEDQALSALTTTPATLLGLSQTLGTVEKGKMANLVVTDKPYFNDKSNVRIVIVNGSIFEYEVPKAAPAAGPAAKGAMSAAKAGGISGKWSYAINAQGDIYDGVLHLNEADGSVKGNWTSNQLSGENELSNPVLAGSRLTFSSGVVMQGASMNLGFDIQFDGNAFSGKVNVPSFGSFDIKGNRLDAPKSE